MGSKPSLCLQVTLVDGTVSDVYRLKVGLRTVTWLRTARGLERKWEGFESGVGRG
jgi:hypothetical protein